jgi:Na+/serine symporter
MKKKVLMFAHVVMALIVVLEINEAPFPHIFSFVGCFIFYFYLQGSASTIFLWH